MKALVIHAKKDLRLEDRPAEDPGPGEVAVRIARGGICGSDLHYYNDGGFGTVQVREPMILGHEVAGTVAALGPGVTGLAVGDPVAVSPSRPDWEDGYARDGIAAPFARHAVLRFGHAHSAHPGRLSRAPRCRDGAMR